MLYGIVTIPKFRMENHFSFLSWNLALLNRSAHAPQHWELCDTEEVVREQVIELSPDIVLFQELPGLVPYIETHNMIRLLILHLLKVLKDKTLSNQLNHK